MFAPFQSNSDELTMAADRVGVALVDNVLISDLFFDAGTGTLKVNHSDPTPGIIDNTKFTALQSSIVLDENNIKKKLGLEYENGNLYDIQIVLATLTTTYPISPDGDPSGSNVGQSKRFVYILKEDSPGVFSYTMAILTVRVW